MSRESSASGAAEGAHAAVALPIRFDDGSMLGLLYRVAAVAAAELVPARLEPLRLGGRAVAMLCGFEYRRSSIGPYAELGVAVLVQPRGGAASALRALLDPPRAAHAGWFIASLPVTTETARSAGIVHWGLPKYLGRIGTDFGARAARVVLEGELEFSHRRGIAAVLAGPPLSLLSERHGTLLQSWVAVEHRVAYGSARSASLRIVGNGPTAAVVRRLGLDRVRPMLAMRCDRLRMRLPAGVALEPQRAPS